MGHPSKKCAIKKLWDLSTCPFSLVISILSCLDCIKLDFISSIGLLARVFETNFVGSVGGHKE